MTKNSDNLIIWMYITFLRLLTRMQIVSFNYWLWLPSLSLLSWKPTLKAKKQWNPINVSSFLCTENVLGNSWEHYGSAYMIFKCIIKGLAPKTNALLEECFKREISQKNKIDKGESLPPLFPHIHFEGLKLGEETWLWNVLAFRLCNLTVSL